MKMFLLLASFAFAGVCPQGQKAVGDDSEQGYKCVAREDGEARPSLKPSGFNNAKNDVKADGGEAAKATDATGSEAKPLGSGLRPIKKKQKNRGDAAPETSGCPKGWKKRGDGCAPPATKKQPD